ncbi:Spore cortex protein YabQ (Spore_YabQ) [Clostridium sp. C105KSO13]|nr:Spore cortex protein YabQ (Spore_YabQ) [Clostridium sp. C105KSO13]
MLGIGKEAVIFLYAGLSGVVIFFGYGVLRLLRNLIRHNIIVINLEDFFYWVAVSVYLFAQMYKTTYGSIRWFFILGVVCGIVLANFMLSLAKKIYKKIMKRLEKNKKSR